MRRYYGLAGTFRFTPVGAPARLRWARVGHRMARQPRSAASPMPPAQLLPSRRRRTVLRLSAAAFGLLVGLALLAQFWPKPDRALVSKTLQSPADLAPLPSRAITLLVIGSDADRLGVSQNGAAPAGLANADSLLLVRVNPEGPTQLLSLAPELAVNLPGQSKSQSLGSLYRQGGVALTAEALRELLGLQAHEPDRYLVLSRSALRRLVDDLGGIEVNPPQAMRYRDRSQKLSISLPAGLQYLKGEQVEQLLRYRDPQQPVESRLVNQQETLRALLRSLAQPAQLFNLPGLVGGLQAELATNLSEAEALSLLAASLSRVDALTYSTLPLAPAKPSHGGLRQLASGVQPPLWPPAGAASQRP